MTLWGRTEGKYAPTLYDAIVNERKRHIVDVDSFEYVIETAHTQDTLTH
ncbi:MULTISPECIES: hypothetical protein [unclassified Vibrio]|nr:MULTISPECIES: hypothetical protein [unclassified Vibrio]